MKRVVLYLFAALWLANTFAFILHASMGFAAPITVQTRAIDAALGIVFALVALWAAREGD